MAHGKILPEDKLLRLIKGNRGGEIPAGAGASEQPPSDFVINRSGTDLNFRFSFLHLKICMAVVLAFAAALFMKNLFFPPYTQTITLEPAVARPLPETAPGTADMPLESYLAGTETRAIFNTNTENPAEGIATANEQAMLSELMADLNLMGVISGADPQAIIEDKKNQRTFYLKKEQYLGKLRVIDIQENKVTMDYNGKQAELHL